MAPKATVCDAGDAVSALDPASGKVVAVGTRQGWVRDSRSEIQLNQFNAFILFHARFIYSILKRYQHPIDSERTLDK